MNTVRDLEKAVASLPHDEYAEFRQWFLQADWEKWDREIAEDAASGKLDFLAREAAEAKQQGTLRDL
jgi:hypothetical protein